MITQNNTTAVTEYFYDTTKEVLYILRNSVIMNSIRIPTKDVPEVINVLTSVLYQ